MSVLRLAGRDGRHRSTFKRNGTQLAEVRRKKTRCLLSVRASYRPDRLTFVGCYPESLEASHVHQ